MPAAKSKSTGGSKSADSGSAPYSSPFGVFTEWNGGTLAAKGQPLAFDFETNIVDLDRFIPQPVVMSVAAPRVTGTDQVASVLVHPSILEPFLVQHQDCLWIGHNVPFDWWVMAQAAGLWSATDRRWNYGFDVWRQAVEEGRVWCTQLMDQLLRLRDGVRDGFQVRPLKELIREAAGIELNQAKEEIRMGFGKYLGRPLSDMTPEESQYAGDDACAALLVYESQVARLGTTDTSDPKWGPLSLTIQVKGALALAQAGRNGIALDQATISAKEKRYRQKANAALHALSKADPDIIKRYKKGSKKTGAAAGDPRVTKGSGMPQLEASHFTDAMSDLQLEYRPEEELPRTDPTKSHPEGQVSTSAEHVNDLLSSLPSGCLKDDRVKMLRAWLVYQELSKTLQFLTKLVDKPELFPHYNYLMRTGRTSCKDPNIQQMPREGWFRKMFVSRPGHKLVTTDYSFIELRTFAAVIESEYGKGSSTLAKMIHAGKDPHCYTASIVRGVTYEEFLSWKDDPAKKADFKNDRQAAKALNFGRPGGLGARRLVDYGRQNYGVVFTPAQADELLRKLDTEVYPEFQAWLADTVAERLHLTIGCPRAEALRWFPIRDKKFSKPEWTPQAKVLMGETNKRDGTAFSPYFIEDTWISLEHLVKGWANDPKLLRQVRAQRGSPDLYRRLLLPATRTLTGRVRAGCDYGEFRNTKFQGLAADGAKLALWNLTARSFTVVAFAHDEIVCEVADDRVHIDQPTIVTIMNESMAEVLYGIPSACESVVGPVWRKA